MKRIKKTLAVVLSVALITTSIPPREVEASWFSDFCGFIFTVGTIPIWVLCPNNPTFRKNNPFRKKAWEVEEEAQKNNYKQSSRLPTRFANTITDKTQETSEDTSHQSAGDTNSVFNNSGNDSGSENSNNDSSLKNPNSSPDYKINRINRNNASMLLTDNKGNVVQNFTGGHQFVVFNTIEELENNVSPSNSTVGAVVYSNKANSYTICYIPAILDNHYNVTSQCEEIYDDTNSIMSSDIPEESFVFYIWNRDYLLEYNESLFRFFPNSNAIEGGINRTFDMSGYNFSVSEIIKKDYVGNTAETVIDNEIPTDDPTSENDGQSSKDDSQSSESEPTKTATPTPAPSSTISATLEATPTKIDDVGKTPNDFNASEGWFKKTIKKIKEWRWYLVVTDFVLAQVDKTDKEHRKTDKKYKREAMDRMDRRNHKDPTKADYRGYRGGKKVITRIAHYARKVSALIEDNMFLTGIGVDGCGNMLTFLISPNRNGIFEYANFNADAIIWRIINNQNVNLNRLPLDNLIALDVALNREIHAAMEHQLIQRRLIDRRVIIADRIATIMREDAEYRRGEPLRDRLDYIEGLGFERLRILAANNGIRETRRYFRGMFNVDERPALVDRVNELMINNTIDEGERQHLREALQNVGLANIIKSASAASSTDIKKAAERAVARAERQNKSQGGGQPQLKPKPKPRQKTKQQQPRQKRNNKNKNEQ